MASTDLDAAGLLEAAHHLVPAGRGRPRKPRLRRAVSTAYYAAFTALTAQVARHQPAVAAGQGLRRLVSHAAARRACAEPGRCPGFAATRPATTAAGRGSGGSAAAAHRRAWSAPPLAGGVLEQVLVVPVDVFGRGEAISAQRPANQVTDQASDEGSGILVAQV